MYDIIEEKKTRLYHMKIDEVKEYVSRVTNGKCEVISDQYINRDTPIRIKCSCGNIFEKKLRNVKRNMIRCNDCVNAERSKKYRNSFEDVKKNIIDGGCEYIGGEYVNSNSILILRCSCGKIFNKKYSKFKAGQKQCQDCGKLNSRNSRFKYDIDSVKEIIKNDGYELLETEYISCDKKMKCKCSKGHVFNLVFNQYLNGCSGCNKCAIYNRSGKNHPMYKNGQSKVSEALRNCVEWWRKDIAKKYNNTCAITGGTENLDVHHYVPFSEIISIASKNTGIPVLKKLCDYESYDDFVLLKNEIISIHKNIDGILISKEIHDNFHNKYKNKKYSKDEFIKFVFDEYGVELKNAKAYS